jgi:hypothetical protein
MIKKILNIQMNEFRNLMNSGKNDSSNKIQLNDERINNNNSKEMMMKTSAQNDD